MTGPGDAPLVDYVLQFAHDVRTPLTAVRGYSDVLARAGTTLTPADRDDLLARISANAAVMEELITGLAAAARQERGE